MSNDIHEETVFTGDHDPVETCDTCGNPMDDRMNSLTRYAGPITELFRKCENCGGPDVVPLGACPRCGGAVFEFENEFACFNKSLGYCDFAITNDYLDSLETFGWLRAEIAGMLYGPMVCCVDGTTGGARKEYMQKIAHSDADGWHVEFTDL